MATKTKSKSKALLIMGEESALAHIEKAAPSIVVRKAAPERNQKEKRASVSDGIVFTTAGRMISEKKFSESFAKKIDASTLTSVYAGMQKRMNAIGMMALGKQAVDIRDGKRKVTRVWANLANGRTIVETIATNREAVIQGILQEQKVNGKAVLTKAQAESSVRSLKVHGFIQD